MSVGLYTSVAAASCTPALVILALISQISPWSPAVLQAIAAVPKPVGYVGFALTLALVVVSWSVNHSRQLPPAFFWTAWWAVLALATVTGILTLAHHPCFALAFLTCLGHTLLYPLRRLVFDKRDPAQWFNAVWVGAAFASLLCLAIWLPCVHKGWPGREKLTDWPEPIRKLVSQHVITWKFAFVTWATPPACAAELGLIAIICWVRKQYADASFHQGDTDLRNAFVVSSIRQLSGWLLALVMIIWISAAFNATGEISWDQRREDMRDEVIGLAFLVFLGLALWTMDTFGPEEVVSAVADSKVAMETGKIVQNDWSRGFVLLVGAIPIVVCVAIDSVFPRKRWRQSQMDDASPYSPASLASSVAAVTHFWVDWRWTSVIVKALWLGLAYHGLVVGVGKVTTVLLAIVNESFSSWPVYSVSAVMFVVAFAIFMFPASPGPPIYVVMGIVITSSALRQGWDFNIALAWSTFVAYVMKLAFTAAAQKWIGEPFASSDRVRQLVGIHTPYMRAIEDILVSRSSTTGKVALLVGGPDWPVAVLAGMLRLPVSQVLKGISPVLFQSVFPCVLSGALLLVPADIEQQQRSQSLAEVSMVVAGALQLVTGLIALYYVQEVLEQNYERLSEKRLEDAKLVEMDSQAEALERAFWRESDWELLPGVLKFSLSMGLVTMEASLGLLAGPLSKLLGGSCFKSFSLMSSLKKDLGGSPLAIVEPLGWLAIALAAISAMSLGSFYAWAQRSLRGSTQQVLEREGQKVL